MKKYSAKSLLLSTLRISGAILVAYLIFLIILFFVQDMFIFFPQSFNGVEPEVIAAKDTKTEVIVVKAQDGTILKGWLVKNSNFSRHPLIIYFGGNSEDVSTMLTRSKWFTGWAVAFVNYRGYGSSEGKPTEKHLFSDALLLYDYLSGLETIDKDRIVAMGRSIGTGVAIYLAKERKVKGVVLVSPYDSVTSIAQKEIPFAPVSLILRHKFDSLSRAPHIKAPMLALIAGSDITIDPSHSHKLVENWGGKHTSITIENVDHNSIIFCGEYYNRINEFLSKL